MGGVFPGSATPRGLARLSALPASSRPRPGHLIFVHSSGHLRRRRRQTLSPHHFNPAQNATFPPLQRRQYLLPHHFNPAQNFAPSPLKRRQNLCPSPYRRAGGANTFRPAILTLARNILIPAVGGSCPSYLPCNLRPKLHSIAASAASKPSLLTLPPRRRRQNLLLRHSNPRSKLSHIRRRRPMTLAPPE